MLTFDNFEYFFDCCKKYCTFEDFVNGTFSQDFYDRTYEAYAGMDMKELRGRVSSLSNEKVRDFLSDCLIYWDKRREKEKEDFRDFLYRNDMPMFYYDEFKDYVPFNAFLIKKFIEDNNYRCREAFENDLWALIYLKCYFFSFYKFRVDKEPEDDFWLLRVTLKSVPKECWESLIYQLQCTYTDSRDEIFKKKLDFVIDGFRGVKYSGGCSKGDIAKEKLSNFLKYPDLSHAIDFCKEKLNINYFVRAYLCCSNEGSRNYIFDNVIKYRHAGWNFFNAKTVIKAESDIRNIVLKIGNDGYESYLEYQIIERAYLKKIPVYFTVMRLFSFWYSRKRDCIDELYSLLVNYLLAGKVVKLSVGECIVQVQKCFVEEHNPDADRLINRMFYNTMFLYINEALGDYVKMFAKKTYPIAGMGDSKMNGSDVVGGQANVVTGLLTRKQFTLNWHDVEFKKDLIVVNPPKNKSVKFVPTEIKLIGSKPSFNYLKDYFDIKMPDVSCTAYKMQLTIDSPISLEKAILDISKISKKYPAKKMQKSLVFVKTRDVECFSKAYDMGLTIDSSYLKKYNSAYIDYLITLHSKNYRLVPCLEVLAHSDNDVSEDSFFFTVEYTKNEEYLILIMENVNPNRATLLFLVRKESYIKDLNEIYDFMSGMEVNKRSTIKVNNARLKECGVVAFKAVNHGYLYEWQQAIRCW